MPKRNDENESLEEETQNKKTKLDVAKDAENGIIQLDSKKKLSVSKFKGTTYIHLREFFEKDGKELPGKKGIALSVAAWEALKSNISEIDDMIKKA